MVVLFCKFFDGRLSVDELVGTLRRRRRRRRRRRQRTTDNWPSPLVPVDALRDPWHPRRPWRPLPNRRRRRRRICALCAAPFAPNSIIAATATWIVSVHLSTVCFSSFLSFFLLCAITLCDVAKFQIYYYRYSWIYCYTAYCSYRYKDPYRYIPLHLNTSSVLQEGSSCSVYRIE